MALTKNFKETVAARLQSDPRFAEAMLDEMRKAKLWNLCCQFVEKTCITCPETISQCDWVTENAYEFIEKVCDVVGYYEEEEHED